MPAAPQTLTALIGFSYACGLHGTFASMLPARHDASLRSLTVGVSEEMHVFVSYELAQMRQILVDYEQAF